LRLFRQLRLSSGRFPANARRSGHAPGIVAFEPSVMAQAMTVKLAREIRAVPLGETVAPNPVHEARTEPGPFLRSTGDFRTTR